MGFYQRGQSGETRPSTVNELVNTLRPGNIVFTSPDPAALGQFWVELTGYEPRPLTGERVGLRDPSGRGLDLTFQPGDVSSESASRCHVEFYVDDPDDVAERALQLGADFVRRASEGDSRWVVLADPDGNEFCIVSSVGARSTP